jgi:general secretion pathway protein F
MAAFLYRAVDAQGRPQRGVIEANSEAGAREALRARRLLPEAVERTSAKAKDERGRAPAASLFARLRPALSQRALAIATRQLSTLVGGGVRVEESLRIIARQAPAPRTASVLLDVRAGVLDGRSLAGALSEHPRHFPEFYRASVAAGEKSGKLGEVLGGLAVFVEDRQRSAQKVQLALAYPALLAVISLAIMTLLLTYVVPDIAEVFLTRGADLPAPTRIVIGLSELLQAYGAAIGLGLLAAAVLAQRWLAIPGNRRRFHKLLADTPPSKAFSRQLNAAQFAGTLATLVQSGVPLVEALQAAGAVTPNLHIRAKVGAAADRVREGTSLQGALAEAGVFPPMLLAIAASGEASGELGPALARAAADQQRELDAFAATLLSLVEPGVLLVMGGVVLLMVLSILLPIVNLNNLAGV